MNFTRFTPLIALAVAATFTITGCTSTETPADTKTPTSDNKLTVYSGREEELVQPLIDIFEEQTGITVDVRYGDSAELGSLVLEEGDKTPAQVFFSQDAGVLGALADANMFVTLPSDITSLVPAGLTSTDDTWVGITGRARVIAYDSEKLTADEVPTSVDAFTEPEWRGRFAIAPSNASFQSFVTAYRVLKGEDAADQWVADVAANDPQIFEKNSAILQAVNDGVVETGLINHYYWYLASAESGEDNMRAQLSFPALGDPGSIVNVTGAGVLKSAANDADAFEFIRFLLSAEGQQYFVDETFEYPLVSGIEAPVGLPELSSLVNEKLDLADLSSLAETQALLQKHGLI